MTKTKSCINACLWAAFSVAMFLALPPPAGSQTVLDFEGAAQKRTADTLTVKAWDGEVKSFKAPTNVSQISPGALVKLQYVPSADGKGSSDVKGEATILGGSLVGTIKEIAADKSWIVVRSQPPKPPGDAWDVSIPVIYSADSDNDVNVSLEVGTELQPLVTAMRTGDGIRAVYLRTTGDRPLNKIKRLEWQSVKVGRFERWGSLVVSAVVLLFIAVFFTGGHPTHLYLGQDNRYSTSKFQTVVWFWVLISAYLAIIAHRILAAGWSYVGGVDIPTNLLILSGISVLTFTAAKAITTSKVEASAKTDSSTGKPLESKPPASEPKIGDLVSDDLNRTDLGDFQMVTFTGLAVLIYAISAVEFMEVIEFRRLVTMPEIDATLLAIFGLGQAAYLGKKATGDVGAGMTPQQAAKRAIDLADAIKSDAGKAAAAEGLATKNKSEASAALVSATSTNSKSAASAESTKAEAAAKTARTAANESATFVTTVDINRAELVKLAEAWSKDTTVNAATAKSALVANADASKAKVSDAAAAKAAEDAENSAKAAIAERDKKTQP